MRAEIMRWCRECSICKRNKSAPHQVGAQPRQPLAVPQVPGAEISIDFLELPESPRGHNYLLVAVDRLTKYVSIAPCKKSVIAAEVADMPALGHGAPRVWPYSGYHHQRS